MISGWSIIYWDNTAYWLSSAIKKFLKSTYFFLFSVPYNLALQYFSFRVNAQHTGAHNGQTPPIQLRGGLNWPVCVWGMCEYTVRVVVFMKDATLSVHKNVSWVPRKANFPGPRRERIKKRGSPCRESRPRGGAHAVFSERACTQALLGLLRVCFGLFYHRASIEVFFFFSYRARALPTKILSPDFEKFFFQGGGGLCVNISSLCVWRGRVKEGRGRGFWPARRAQLFYKVSFYVQRENTQCLFWQHKEEKLIHNYCWGTWGSLGRNEIEKNQNEEK